MEDAFISSDIFVDEFKNNGQQNFQTDQLDLPSEDRNVPDMVLNEFEAVLNGQQGEGSSIVGSIAGKFMDYNDKMMQKAKSTDAILADKSNNVISDDVQALIQVTNFSNQTQVIGKVTTQITKAAREIYDMK